MNAFFVLIVFLSFILQASYTSIPLLPGVLLLLYLFKRAEWVFVFALVLGVLLDIVLVRKIGISSLFFIGFLTIISIYERKLEIYTKEFVGIVSFLGGVGYLLILGESNVLLQAGLGSLMSVLLFLCVKRWFAKSMIAL
ncbi:MAG: hypothetical protein AAB907_03140 [Patescibacteria group bacterium]